MPSYVDDCLTLVFNEDLQEFVSEHTYRAQALLPLPGRGLLSLPLPGVASSQSGQFALWQHGALAATGSEARAASYYGFAHGASAEFIVSGSSTDVQKELQTLYLVCDGPDPVSLIVSTPTQGSFEQTLVGGASNTVDILKRNLRRKSDTTYLTVQVPAVLPWGGRARGKWLRLRLTLAAGDGTSKPIGNREQTRLLRVQTLVRDVAD